MPVETTTTQSDDQMTMITAIQTALHHGWLHRFQPLTDVTVSSPPQMPDYVISITEGENGGQLLYTARGLLVDQDFAKHLFKYAPPVVEHIVPMPEFEVPDAREVHVVSQSKIYPAWQAFVANCSIADNHIQCLRDHMPQRRDTHITPESPDSIISSFATEILGENIEPKDIEGEK